MLKDTRPPRIGTAPAHLEEPERDLWDRLIRSYRFDDPASLELLMQAMEARARARQARELLKDQGPTIKDDRGNLKAHPLLSVERSAQASFLSAMRLLRLDLTGSTKQP
jgi:P27 family predicted phage terminase small subunit